MEINMEPIRVPRPPAEAFNKDRRISDLIRAQVNHFKHVEHKLPPEQRRTIPQHGITTEAEAAKYIAAMTEVLRGQPIPSGIVRRKTAAKKAIPIRPAAGLAIAAGAESNGSDDKGTS
jgi:hypothetical protein